MRRDLSTATIAIVVFTLVLGLAYPLGVTGIAQVALPSQANGGTIEQGGKTFGSKVIGQDFSRPLIGKNGEPKETGGEPVTEPDPAYFQPRPSATGYDPSITYFNNLGPNSKDLAKLFDDNVATYLDLNGTAYKAATGSDLVAAMIPPDAVTTSASGVDPHISERNAALQAPRIAAERGLDEAKVVRLIAAHTDGRSLGFFGEPGVNVVEMNLALDQEAPR